MRQSDATIANVSTRWRSKGEGIQFPETRAYVKRVEHLTSIYRRAWHSKLYPSRQSTPVTVTA